MTMEIRNNHVMTTGANVGAGISPRDTLLDNNARQLHSLAERLEAQTEALDSLADRIFGCRPTAVRNDKDGKGPPPAPNAMTRINEGFARLEVAVEALGDAQRRLTDIA
jgi:hypothetical protein